MKFLRLLIIALLALVVMLLFAADSISPTAFLLSKIGGLTLLGIVAIVCLFYDKRGMLDDDKDHEWH